MSQPIGVRIPDEILNKIDKMSNKEFNDRSTVIRKLILLGFSHFLKQMSAEEYIKGNLTLSESAKQAEVTIWEMERFLVEQGYKSDYSIDDLEEEMKVLDR